MSRLILSLSSALALLAGQVVHGQTNVLQSTQYLILTSDTNLVAQAFSPNSRAAVSLSTGAAFTNFFQVGFDEESRKLLVRTLTASRTSEEAVSMLKSGFGQVSAAITNPVHIVPDHETSVLLRKATEDDWFKKDTLVNFVLGGLLALAGVILAHFLMVRKERKAEAEMALGIIKMIQAEAQIVYAFLRNGIGKDLYAVPGNQYLESRFLLTQNFLTVFDACAPQLWRIDITTAERIIAAYARLKSLFEYLGINTKLLFKRQDLLERLQQNQQDRAALDNLDSVDHNLRENATFLKDIWQNVQQDYEGLGWRPV